MKQLKAIVIGLALCLVLGAGVEAFASSQGMVKRQKKEAPAPKKEPKPASKAALARPDRSGRDSYGREYVDLGLPGGVLWATCNVGASTPEEYGLYFAWGETVGYAKGETHTFDWAHYKWCNGRYNSLTKYCTNSNHGRVDNKKVLDAADDAATANWGTGWRMPTDKELYDLKDIDYCTWTWKTNYNGSGVNGYEVKSKSNGNSIFLPAAGYRGDSDLYDSDLNGEGSDGIYWSRELSTETSDSAYVLDFYSSYIGWSGSSRLRYYGRSVRAVRVPTE